MCTLPCSAAMCSAVMPAGPTNDTLALASTSFSTTSAWLLMAAAINGVTRCRVEVHQHAWGESRATGQHSGTCEKQSGRGAGTHSGVERIHGGAGCQKCHDDLYVAFASGNPQWRALRARRINVGAVLDEGGDNSDVVVQGCQVQRRVAVLARGVAQGTGVQQELHHIHVAAE